MKRVPCLSMPLVNTVYNNPQEDLQEYTDNITVVHQHTIWSSLKNMVKCHLKLAEQL